MWSQFQQQPKKIGLLYGLLFHARNGFSIKNVGFGVRIRECSQRKMHCCAWPNICTPRKYWIIYRGPGFLAVVWCSYFPTPSPSLPANKLDWRDTGRPRKRDNLLTGKGVGEEPIHTTARKPVHYNSSILSVQGKVRAKHKLKQMMIETDANRTFIR